MNSSFQQRLASSASLDIHRVRYTGYVAVITAIDASATTVVVVIIIIIIVIIIIIIIIVIISSRVRSKPALLRPIDNYDEFYSLTL